MPIRRASFWRSSQGTKPVARARRQDAGQNLQRRRLAGAVRPDEGDALARPDGEGDPAYSGDLGHRPLLEHAGKALRAARAKALGEVLDEDGFGRHDTI